MFSTLNNILNNISDVFTVITPNPVVCALILLCELIILFFLIKLAIYMDHPKTLRGFKRIVGMDQLKEQMYQEVIFPYRHKHRSKKFHLSLPNGILFYGPPGCGKTFFAQCLAEELNIKFISISHGDLAAHHIHETVEKIADTFKQARAQVPCLVFFDEIEGLVPSRAKLNNAQRAYKIEEVNEFLFHLNNASKDGLLVVGATNHLDMIDEAVQRSGRFDLKIYISPPDKIARQELFRNFLQKIPHSSLIDYSVLSQLTLNYTSADILSIVQGTARYAATNHAKIVTQEMLENRIKKHNLSLKHLSKKEDRDNNQSSIKSL